MLQHDQGRRLSMVSKAPLHPSTKVPMVPEAPARPRAYGLLLRWGSFGPRELAQFKELLEKPVRLKPGTVGMSKEEFEQRRARKGLREMLSAVKERVGKDKLGSSKSEERGVCEGNHNEDTDEYGNGNSDNCGNRKPQVGKKKPKRKRDKLKCFLCDGPHMLKKCPIKCMLRKISVDKALGLGSSARDVEAKEAESEKKPVECFLCHGPHKLRKCLRKSVIDGNDGVDTESKKLGSSKGKVEAKRAKRSESVIEGTMKQTRSPRRLVRARSSEGLPPKEEVSLSSNLEEEVAMKTVKLGPMRLKSSEASELAELSIRLPPIGEVGGASGFKEKEVIHVGQLTRVNAKVHSEHSDSVLHSNLLTWRERRGPFEVLKQGGRETVGKVKPSVVNHEDSIRGKIARVKKRRKPRQKSRRKGRAKATSGIQGKSSQCHSGVTTRTLREWVGENVTGQSSNPVTIEPNGGLLLRWGLFGPQELARFKELLEKPVRLKPGWPDSEDMAT
ncbi:hypothetical protein PVK06_005630 [Gossypium arboreum]|uniref:Uncharacterized protein n=1 Tax=Gossypium arboreum TaxID=29729 RepID=A0ABR0QW31_GOSAR|nr:hypothetical protein PVK06_005630 [Gossypium arboreum]